MHPGVCRNQERLAIEDKRIALPTREQSKGRTMKTIRLWDTPLRLFHWLLATAVVAAFATGLSGGNLMVWHGRIGVLIAALLAFRLTWGMVGSTYARFRTFVRGPATIAAYLRGRWQGIGHNPLGALSVLGMLAILTAQLLSGLAASDDIAFQGPYNILASKETEQLATFLHKQLIWLLGVLIGLHLMAIVYYTRVRKENLIQPMLTGTKILPAEHPAEEARGGGWVALAFALLTAIGAGWVAAGGPVAYLAPAPAPVTETPNW
jgi:cytochrome b